jgi:hypothetical protein
MHKGEWILAVRSQSQRIGAGQLVRAIVGDEGTAGGHGTMAGGHMPLRGQSPERLANELGQRARQHLGIPETIASKPLLEAHLLPNLEHLCHEHRDEDQQNTTQ